jgi:REP element-mobilizing transposase RayT/transposase-like protein
MSRPLRIELAGGLYHVTSRGVDRGAIYFDDADRERWLDVLGEVCERYRWRVHAWCQMTNHYHLVIETPEANLAEGMRQLNGVHTQSVNRRRGRCGHLFQGRYRAILVERDAYLLELARYVVLNPVRAGMVKGPRQWPWSSYRAMVGVEATPSWLLREWILGQFARRRSDAIVRYVDFVRAGVGLPSIWEQLKGQIYLGGDRFVAQMQALLQDDRAPGELLEVPRAQRWPLPAPLAQFERRHAPREAAMVAAFRSGGYSMAEIGRHFGVHYSTVSRYVRKASRSAAEQPQTRQPVRGATAPAAPMAHRNAGVAEVVE